MRYLDELERKGAMAWRAEHQAWVAAPEPVVQALTDEGFLEFKRETAKCRRTHATTGGMWQGLDPQTGIGATVIWITRTMPPETHVIIEIDGRPVEGNAWAEIDGAILGALAAAGGQLTPAQIATRVGMSEGAVQSVVSMLAEQGKVRIAAVELSPAAPPGGDVARRPLALAPAPPRPRGESVAS